MADHKHKNSDRGLVSMDDDKRRETARHDGQRIPEKTSFPQDRELASEPGQKSGKGRPRIQNEGQYEDSGAASTGRPGLGGYGEEEGQGSTEHFGPEGRPGLGGYGSEQT